MYQEALQQAVDEAIAEVRSQLVDIEAENKALLEEKGMTIINYDQSFFDEIMALADVQALYEKIDDETNGLAQTLLDELAAT